MAVLLEGSQAWSAAAHTGPDNLVRDGEWGPILAREPEGGGQLTKEGSVQISCIEVFLLKVPNPNSS